MLGRKRRRQRDEVSKTRCQGLCARAYERHLGGRTDAVLAGSRHRERGFRHNLRHWIDDLGIDGIFICGKQGEFFSMSIAERKRCFELAVEETAGKSGTIMSCSDQNLDTVIELARHAQNIGAEYIVVHAPVLHFVASRDETLYEYYRYISEQVEIGIALWSHPDSGYLMSPELCARLADLPNIVAIKYSASREMYAKLTRIARSEEHT